MLELKNISFSAETENGEKDQSDYREYSGAENIYPW
jgi:hypothetical protein